MWVVVVVVGWDGSPWEFLGDLLHLFNKKLDQESLRNAEIFFILSWEA